MATLNKVMLIGNLGKEPELKSFENDKQKASFTLATTEKFKDKSVTTWHNVVAWGKLAGICAEYLKKGSQVYVEGRITHREYEKDGDKKQITEIVVETMQMLGSKSGDNVRKGEPVSDISEPEANDDGLPF